MNDRETISTNGVGMLFPTGTAYVSIPDGVDRDKFIQRCLRTQTLFIRGEAGEAWKNIFISKSLLQDIVFPDTPKLRGSLVTWVKQPKHNVPIIVGLMNLKDSLSEINRERQFRFQKRSKSGNVVDINGLADDASLDITVSSKDDNKGKIRIKVSNPTNDSSCEVYVNGSVDVFADKKIRLASNEEILVELVKKDGSTLANFSYKNGVGFALKDEFNNEVVTKSKSVYLKEGSSGGRQLEVNDTVINLGTIGGSAEPGVLGNKNETALNDIKGILQDIKTLLQSISTGDAAGVIAAASYGITLTYATQMGVSAGTLTAKLATLGIDIPKTKSTKVKTD